MLSSHPSNPAHSEESCERHESPILPAWPAFTRPTLSVLADGEVWRTADLRQSVADEMQLTDGQRVTQIRNGYSKITEFGLQLLTENPGEISETTLKASLPTARIPKRHNVSSPDLVDDPHGNIWDLDPLLIGRLFRQLVGSLKTTVGLPDHPRE